MNCRWEVSSRVAWRVEGSGKREACLARRANVDRNGDDSPRDPVVGESLFTWEVVGDEGERRMVMGDSLIPAARSEEGCCRDWCNCAGHQSLK
jgi:hypothetical protein